MPITQTDLDHFYRFARRKIEQDGANNTLAELVALFEQGRKFDETVSSISADIDEEQMRRFRTRDEPEDQKREF